MTKVSETHNRLAGEIVKQIVKPTLESGGNLSDVMILTESVVVGVCLAVVRLGGDEAVLDVVIDGARKRLAEIRLSGLPTRGSS